MANIIWNRYLIPKHAFHIWLVCHERPLTRDRLKTWGMAVVDASCVLCGQQAESIDHLYFECAYSKSLLQLVCV